MAYLLFLFFGLSAVSYRSAEVIKNDRYVKQTVIISSRMESLIAEMIRLFGPYEARLLESAISQVLPSSWIDPRAKVEIFYIKTQKSKIIQYILFVGSGKKIEIYFKDSNKKIVVENATNLFKMDFDPKYNLSFYKLPTPLLNNLNFFLKKTNKNPNSYLRFSVFYSSDFSIKAIVFLNHKNQKEYCVLFSGMLVNRSGYSFSKTSLTPGSVLSRKLIISSRFGFRIHPVLKIKRFHSGVDYAASHGSSVFSAFDGRVSFIGWITGYGYCVKISHSASVSSLYAHLSKFSSNLKLGSFIKRGALIGFSGSSGLTSGPHLHFEIRINNKPVNPVSFIFSFYKRLSDAELKLFYEFIKQIDSLDD